MCIARKPGQRGLVLVVALLVLLMLSLLVTAVMRGSTLQLRMARNLESAALERELALGEIERILQELGPIAPEGARGYLSCTGNHSGEACDNHSLAASVGVAGPVEAYVRVVADTMPPPRMAEVEASSGLAYRAVHYEVGAVSGRTSLVQGVMVLVPESTP